MFPPMKSLLGISAFLSLFSGQAIAEDYGPFFILPDAPKVAILNGEIDLRTPLAFKRLLSENPQIVLVALNSPGGLVQPALLVAEEVHERKLHTFIPENSSCASACAFIFFAGNGRFVAGQLGVHQIYGSNDVTSTQLNLSDIIEMLAKYDVSPTVITKMLRTPPNSTYFFTKDELQSLGIQADPKQEIAGSPAPATIAPRPAPPTSNTAQSGDQDAMQEAVARNMALELIATGQMERDQMLSKSVRSYADPVDFYGKMLTRKAVMESKASYVDRWPERRVIPRMDTIKVSCSMDVCSIAGVYEWFVNSPKRKKSLSGVSNFLYQLRMTDPPVVFKENGEVIERFKLEKPN